MTRLLDISTELLLQKYAGGIKLVRPDRVACQYTTGFSLGSTLKVPLNFFAYDLENNVQFSNDQHNQICGFLSNEDVRGRHVSHFVDVNSTNELICNNQMVIHSNVFKIIDEYSTRHDGFHIGATTLKFPWYNEQDDIVGIIGCSITSSDDNQPPLAQSLSLLLNMGLLNSSVKPAATTFPGLIIENTYFSKREKDVLLHLVRGKTAREISLVLGISFRTVETHISNAKNKMCVRTKSELIEKIFNERLSAQ